MPSFYLFAWIASLAFALSTVIGKLLSRHSISNPWRLNFYWNLFDSIIIIPIALFAGAGMPTHWTNTIFASFFIASTVVLFTASLYRADVSVIAPLWNFRTIFLLALGAWFLQENLQGQQYFLIFVIFALGFFAAMDERFSVKTFFSKATTVVIASTLASAIAYTFLKQAILENGFWTTTLWTGVISQLILCLTIPLFRKGGVGISRKQARNVLLLSIAEVVGILAMNRAVAGNATISSAIISLPISMVLAFMFSRFAPQLLEHHSLRVYAIRFGAAALMILAALKL